MSNYNANANRSTDCASKLAVRGLTHSAGKFYYVCDHEMLVTGDSLLSLEVEQRLGDHEIMTPDEIRATLGQATMIPLSVA